MTYLAADEKMKILNDFPRHIKPSYENLVHKTVYSDMVMAIPEGKKYFAWFTNSYLKNHNRSDTCFLLEVGLDRTSIVDVKSYRCCYSQDLKQGTILYGTKFEYNKRCVFAIEDVLFYKGDEVSYHETWQEKMEYFHKLMKFDIKQVTYDKTYVLFGLPVISTNYHDLLQNIANIPEYNVCQIQFRDLDMNQFSQCVSVERENEKEKGKNDGMYKLNESRGKRKALLDSHLDKDKDREKDKEKEKRLKTSPEFKLKQGVFTVKPGIQNDIYYLYRPEYPSKLKYIDVALIPDLKTSIMMNNLFRNIKENKNLDALEESDDDEEFEDEREDRFVFMEREYSMLCTYHFKFKKWIPTQLVS